MRLLLMTLYLFRVSLDLNLPFFSLSLILSSLPSPLSFSSSPSSSRSCSFHVFACHINDHFRIFLLNYFLELLIFRECARNFVSISRFSIIGPRRRVNWLSISAVLYCDAEMNRYSFRNDANYFFIEVRCSCSWFLCPRIVLVHIATRTV